MQKVGEKWLHSRIDVVRSAEPKPFPGKNPTRCFVFVKWRPKKSRKPYRQWTYTGKIRPHVAKKVMKFLQTPGLAGEITAIEFDRNGTIARANQPLIGVPDHTLRVSDWNQEIWRFYHPSGWEFGDCITWAALPVFRKILKYKGRKFMIYFRVETWGLNTIAGHKKWLDQHKWFTGNK